MKETGTEYWNSPNTGADNESGFTGLPAGYRAINSGTYYSLGYYTYFWTSVSHNLNKAKYSILYYNSSLFSLTNNRKQYGFSVRCLED
jgi:uncharacterized protein (TIGR02145 family)